MEDLKKLNPEIIIEYETEHFILKNLWNDETFMIRLLKNENYNSILNISFPKELSAILHTTKDELEFIMEPQKLSSIEGFTEFSFFFENTEFKCSFKDPSDELIIIANGFRELGESSETDYRFLRQIRDFLRKDDMPSFIQKYFENRKPVSFVINGDFKGIDYNFKELAKHFNFYVSFYNRRNPIILIHEEKENKIAHKIPCMMDENSFPDRLTFNSIDPVLLDMFEIARYTRNVRLQFLFYFQILEYCSYYYLNDELTKQLRDVIKRPDLLNNSNEYTKLIVDQFKDHFKHNDDSMKLEKTIGDYCSFEDIKIELKQNLDSFTKPIEFEGGFKLDAILNDQTCIDKPPKQILRTVKNNIERIRNTLVHLRESRENKIILPTEKNNNLLIPYLYVVRRLAEKVAIIHGK